MASVAARTLQRIIPSFKPQIKVRQTQKRSSLYSCKLRFTILSCPQLSQFSTSTSALAAQVQKPAPEFKAQAVVGGQFKEVSLEDYKVRLLQKIFHLYKYKNNLTFNTVRLIYCIVRASMSWSTSIPLTSPSCAPPRSLPSLTESRSSKPSIVR